MMTTYGSKHSEQHLWILSTTKFLHNGYYVEMGAVDGIYRSNTYILEKDYGWQGILVEPDVRFTAELQKNRPNSKIDFNCVWSTSGKTKMFYQSPSLKDSRSTVEDFATIGRAKRKSWRKYTVNTISLLDLLKQHNAPTHIDYLSLDTEGSELEILQGFDFTQYEFGCITVEHNQRPDYREQIRLLLNSNGYYTPKKCENLFLWDDCYVLKN
jgi:hypothetical protein